MKKAGQAPHTIRQIEITTGGVYIVRLPVNIPNLGRLYQESHQSVFPDFPSTLQA